jgi:hypothetical protein
VFNRGGDSVGIAVILAAAAPGERAGGAGTATVVARCVGDAGRVLERGREVLRAVLAYAGSP